MDSSGNVYLTGAFSSPSISFNGGSTTLTNAGIQNIFLAKFDTNGNPQWSKSFGGTGADMAQSVAVDSNGYVYLTGTFSSSSINFGGGAMATNGGYDIFLAKFSTGGALQWQKSFGGTSTDAGQSVAVDSSGNVYLTGYFWSSSLTIGSTLTNQGNDDVFLAKFNSSGTPQWAKSFGGTGEEGGQSLAVDSSGNVYLTGVFNSSSINLGGGALTNAGTVNMFLAKFNPSGTLQWQKSFGGTGSDSANGLVVDSGSNVYLTGGFSSSSINFSGGTLNNAGNYDIFLAKFNTGGTLQWQKSFGGTANDAANGLGVDSSGNVYLTGWFASSSISFGGGTLNNNGGNDIFLVRLKQ